jgi:hypothetical protein
VGKTTYVSVDSGNGYTNAVAAKLRGRIKKTSFPSVRADAPTRTLDLGAGREVQYELVKWMGHIYTYGADTVRLSAGAIERHHGQERYGDEFHGMLVAIAMARMGIKSSSDVELTLFMPPGLCTSAHKEHVRKSFAEGLAIVVNGVSYEWTFAKIDIHPEGLGAVLAFMLNARGKQLSHELFSGNVLIVDSGTYTLDVLLITDGNFDPASLETATHPSDGLYQHIIKPLLAAVHRHDDDFKVITADMLDKAIYESHYSPLRECKVVSAGKEMCLTEALDAVAIKYTNWIIRNIFDTEYRGLQGIKSVIVVGGGSHVIYDKLKRDSLIGDKVLVTDKLSQLKDVRPTELNAVGGLRWSRFNADK